MTDQVISDAIVSGHSFTVHYGNQLTVMYVCGQHKDWPHLKAADCLGQPTCSAYVGQPACNDVQQAVCSLV